MFDHPGYVLAFLALGASAGFLSGLIGIGGGFVLVPGLYYVFYLSGIAPGHELYLALGTTMASILFAASGAVRPHFKHGVVRIDVVKRMFYWASVGTGVGAVMATAADPEYIKYAFAAFCFYSAGSMLFFVQMVDVKNRIENTRVEFVSLFFGSVCGLIGIGGANLFVPYLMRGGLDLRGAMATGSAMQIPIAIAGAVSFMALGWGSPTPEYSVGYVYLPALCVIAVSSVIAAPFGVRVSRGLSIPVLNRIFGVFTAAIGLKMAGAFQFLAS